MTDEIELFVNLLNDQEANRILSAFKETIPGRSKKNSTLDHKKTYILKIFKRQTPKMIRAANKQSVHPFYFYINKFKDYGNYKNLEEEDYLKYLADDDAPDYFKFAVSLLHFPEKTREMIPELIKKTENNEPLFDQVVLETNEEVISFYRNTKAFVGIDKAIQSLKDHLKPWFSEEIEKNRDVYNQVEKMSILEFHNNMEELKELLQIEQLLYLYAVTHPEEEKDILLGMYINSSINLIEIFSDMIKNENEKVNENESQEETINKLNDTILNLQEDLSAVKAQAKEDQVSFKKSKREHQEWIKINEKLEGNVAALEIKLNNFNKEKSKLNQKISELSKANADLRKKHEVQIKSLKQESRDELNLIDKELNSTKKEVAVYHDFFPPTETKQLFGIVFTFNNGVGETIQQFHPDVLVVSIHDWKKSKELFYSNKVEHVYIQRNFMSSSKFNQVKNFMDELNIGTTTIPQLNDVKELIETIFYYKVKWREKN